MKSCVQQRRFEAFFFQVSDRGVASWLVPSVIFLSNKVPYNIFSKWYKDSRRKMEAVQVDNRFSESSVEKSELPIQVASRYSSPKVEQASLEGDVSANSVRIWVELHMGNGLYLSRKNLSY